MRNRKVRDLGQSEEDSLEATSKSSDGSKSSTSSSACTFSLSGQTLGNGSSSPALQGIKEEEEQQQQQQLEQDQERALLSSMERALGGADEQQQQQEEAEPPKRCSKCNKKLGLTGGFPCRCGGVFCNVHRYSDRHECNFDYRELGANEIRRDNPLTVPSKLKKL